MKTRVVVSAIIQKDNKLLFGRKLQNVGPYPNTWIIIGGGVNLEDERLEEALKREVKEEANIKIKNIKRISFDEDYEPDKKGGMTHYLFLVYHAKYDSGEIKAGDDVSELKWFDKKELNSIQLSRPTIKLFKQLGWI